MGLKVQFYMGDHMSGMNNTLKRKEKKRKEKKRKEKKRKEKKRRRETIYRLGPCKGWARGMQSDRLMRQSWWHCRPCWAGEKKQQMWYFQDTFLLPGGWGLSQLRELPEGVPGYLQQADILLGFAWFFLIPKNSAESKSLHVKLSLRLWEFWALIRNPWSHHTVTRAIFKNFWRTGEMAQQLRALTALQEVLSSITSNHMVAHNQPPVIGFDALF